MGLTRYARQCVEFTQDHWTTSHLNANRDGSPSIAASPYWYVTKGGSWFDPAARARSAARKKRYMDEMDTNLGFRLVQGALKEPLTPNPLSLKGRGGERTILLAPLPLRERGWGEG
nr:SUMF1/EgtB/PvdO family nonheme iron enzyme [Thiothrix subterranea]